MKTILVTGGAGYIGSHTALELLNAGYKVIIVDDLSNGNIEAVRRVETLTNKTITFIEADLQDKEILTQVFIDTKPETVIHFAGLKAVGESVAKPLFYYRTNLVSSLSLFEVMQEQGVNELIFSSSATVYGDPAEIPLTESSPTPAKATNPYGQTKLMIEHIIEDVSKANNWKSINLRYFNPVGAHKSGQIGEDPKGLPNNLAPFVSKVAAGILDELKIYGNDYDTPDGTGIRDYIHVVDLAKGHVAALENLPANGSVNTYNLGTGKGYSVLDMVAAFEKATDKKVPYTINPRRPGDIATCYCTPIKAEKELNWKAELGLEQMVADAWNWQTQNPQGY